MDIYPAIDLKEGKAVRLYKGVMESAKIYSDEPYKIAQAFEKMGATWLHLVDLDGAFAGGPVNFEAIRQIREHTNLKIELGGGIRSEEIILKYKELGIDRFILGSIAAKAPNFVKDMAQKYNIAVGLDAINGYVATEGWASETTIPAEELALKFKESGVQAIICTDIAQDGTLEGVNIDFTLKIKQASALYTIASGGVKDLEDILLANKNGIDGIIIGKAYYEGKVDLSEAFLSIR